MGENYSVPLWGKTIRQKHYQLLALLSDSKTTCIGRDSLPLSEPSPQEQWLSGLINSTFPLGGTKSVSERGRCQSLRQNTLIPPPSAPSPPIPQFPVRPTLEKAFRCVKPAKRAWLQTQGRDVRNVRFLHGGVGGGEGEGTEEQDKAAKDKAWETSQAMAR